jgi:hypothetical protein
VEHRRLHVNLWPFGGETLAQADVQGEAEVTGPKVDAILAAHSHLVHVLVENLCSS